MDINKLCPGCMHEVNRTGGIAKCPICGYDLTNIKNDVHQLPPFTILNGKYLVGKVIGEGGFGITYLGYDLNLEIPIAIKEYYPTGFVTREATHTTTISAYAGKNTEEFNKWKEGFIKEARSLAKFSNLAGIVEVRDFFLENNTAYIVMEYIDGITLKDYLKQQGGKLPADMVFMLMNPIINSLSKVHAEGIIHRDISPDNIMITNDGRMKLLDFGAARDVSSNAEKSLSVLLKPGYAPEEQYRTRGHQGTWSDVYAICATIYKCITGVTPIESMERLREDNLKMPSELGIGISTSQEAALKKGLAVYADHRTQTMDELMNAIEGKGKAIEKSISMQIPSASTPQYKPQYTSNSTNSSTDFSKVTEFIEKNKIVIIAVCVVLMLIVVLKIGVSSGNSGVKAEEQMANNAVTEEVSGSESAGDEATPANSNYITDASAIDTMCNEAETIYNDNLTKLNDPSTRAEGIAKMLEAMQKLYGIDPQSEGFQRAQGIINNVVFNYSNAVVSQKDFLMQQQPQKAIYEQITMDLDGAYNNLIATVEQGYQVDLTQIENEKNDLPRQYKNRYITVFDTFINESEWGRRANWEFIQEPYELFGTSGPDDPLELRYRYAYAWYYYQTIFEEVYDKRTMSQEDACLAILDQLEAADYCEFLVEAAEEYWDANKEDAYSRNVEEVPIIADSSERSYTYEDIAALHLSSSQLRFARLEIYSRHGLSVWDYRTAEFLAYRFTNVPAIDRFKFASYNDFGEFSTDSINGLTPIERNNIRSIMKYQINEGLFFEE